MIVTDAGTCDRAYRYGVRIAHGRIYYDAESGIDFSGHVDASGRVSVRLRAGGSTAQGSGRLTAAGGQGRWAGVSSSSRCSGHWVAERRSAEY